MDFHVEFVVSFFFIFFYFAKQAIILVPVGKFINMYSGGWVGSLSNSNNLLQLLLLDFSIIAKHKKI